MEPIPTFIPSLRFSFVNPNECFQQARMPGSGLTVQLCVSRVIIVIFTIVLLIAVSVLLHLQLSHKGWFNKSTYRTLKTWLLILITLYAIDNVVRYVFLIQNAVFFLPILITGVMLHSVIIYLISFYYVEKALHLSEDTQKIKKGLLFSILGFVSIYIAIWIYDLKNY